MLSPFDTRRPMWARSVIAACGASGLASLIYALVYAAIVLGSLCLQSLAPWLIPDRSGSYEHWRTPVERAPALP